MWNRRKLKRKRAAPRLDFYTPLSPAECMERVLRESARYAPGWQRVAKTQDAARISVRRLMIRRTAWWKWWQVVDRREVVFAGQLIAHHGGTLVQGKIRQEKTPTSSNSPLLMPFIYLMILVPLISAKLVGLLIAIVFLLLGRYHRRQQQRIPMELLDWIHDLLHEPPADLIDSETDEPITDETETQITAAQWV
jgi:hypothetical protein